MKEAEFAVETNPNYLEAEKGANENPSVACQVLATQGQGAVRDLIEVLRRRRAAPQPPNARRSRVNVFGDC